MRFFRLISTLLCLLTVDTALAQQTTSSGGLSAYPTCAMQCLLKLIPTTKCGLTDMACLCTNQAFNDAAAKCWHDNCTPKDTLRAWKASSIDCKLPVRNKSIQIRVIIPLFVGLATVMLVLRLLSRIGPKAPPFGWDDALIMLAYLPTAGKIPVDLLLTFSGLGRDIWLVNFTDLTQFFKLFYGESPFVLEVNVSGAARVLVLVLWFAEWDYLLAVPLTKISILFFYLRIFPKSRVTLIIKLTLWFVGVTSLGFFFLVIFQCWPISHLWTQWTGETHGKCLSLLPLLWVQAAFNIVQDLLILLVPLPTVLKLQMNYSWRRKIRVLIMFGAGVFVTAISIVRLWALSKMATLSRPNTTYDWQDLIVWSGMEACTGVMCACLPGTRIFFIKTLPNWFNTVTTSLTRPQGANSNGSVSAGNLPHLPPQHQSRIWSPSAKERALQSPDTAVEYYSEQPKRSGSQSTAGSYALGGVTAPSMERLADLANAQSRVSDNSEVSLRSQSVTAIPQMYDPHVYHDGQRFRRESDTLPADNLSNDYEEDENDIYDTYGIVRNSREPVLEYNGRVY